MHCTPLPKRTKKKVIVERARATTRERAPKVSSCKCTRHCSSQRQCSLSSDARQVLSLRYICWHFSIRQQNYHIRMHKMKCIVIDVKCSAWHVSVCLCVCGMCKYPICDCDSIRYSINSVVRTFHSVSLYLFFSALSLCVWSNSASAAAPCNETQNRKLEIVWNYAKHKYQTT